jgi:hypothetical protein
MCPLAQFAGVVPQFRNSGHNAFAIARHTIAIHVASKYDETQFRQPLCSSFGMRVEPGATMHH